MKRILQILTLHILTTSCLYAQTFKEHRGDIFFDKFNFGRAVNLYQEALLKDSSNNGLIRKIAHSYKLLGKDSLSSVWYDRLFSTGQMDSSDYNNYYIVLKNIQSYDKANEILRKSQSLSNDSKYLISRNFADNLKSKTYRYNIYLIKESSEYTDFSPAYFGNKLIFVSARQGSGVMKRTYTRDGQPFLQLFIADTLSNGQLQNIREFSSLINTRYHEGPVSYNLADSSLYFTRNNFNYYKKLSSDGKLNLKIFTTKFTYNEWLKSVENFVDSIGIKTKLTEKDWRNIEEFEFNSDEYSTGHPSVSLDGKTLYFTSDRPGGKGGTDIYKCEKNETGHWGPPVNLHDLNTKGNEMFPFIHPSGLIFFASDGLAGLGGLDIFKADPTANGFTKPENMGAPLNSSFDDFGLIVDSNNKTGYFSSNRSHGIGSDDLYHVQFTNIRYLTLAVKIKDKETGASINQASVQLSNTINNFSDKQETAINGYFPFKATSTDKVMVEVQKNNYKPFNLSLALEEQNIINDTIYLLAELEKSKFYGVFGSVFLKETNEIVKDVNITFHPYGSSDSISVNTGNDDEFRIILKENTIYEVIVAKKDFFTIKETYTTENKTQGWVNLNQFINLKIEKIDLNKTIEIPNIYYDLGKWNIRKDAAIELDKVVALLVNNPNIKIELGSHTDSRGDANSNQKLSQKRAQSAVDYIISKGINKDRIVAMGYGESKIKNRCADGVKCSEEEHQENRRTEIRILSF